MSDTEKRYLTLLQGMKRNNVSTLDKTINEILIYEERYSVAFVDEIYKLKK